MWLWRAGARPMREQHARKSRDGSPHRDASPITSRSTGMSCTGPPRPPRPPRCHERLPSVRIEMVLPTLDAAGMEVMVANLTRGLVGRGHEVGVTCLEEDGLIADELRAVGVRVAVIRNPGFRGVLRPTRLEAWLRQVRPDLVHAHSGGWLKAGRAAHR